MIILNFGTHDLNRDGNFQNMFNFIIQGFRDVLSWLDNIKIGNFSMLDFFLGLLIFGLIIAVTLNTVSNFVGNSGEHINKMYNKAVKNNKKQSNNRSSGGNP